MKQDTIKLIKQHKIITIVRGLPNEKIIPVAQALYDGGIRLMEITFNQSSETTIEDTTNAIKSVYEKFGDKLCVGAGTVVTTKQATAAFEAGAKYLISPNVDTDVISLCNKLGMVSIPGALTPSEIVLAHNSGADYVKLFPAGNFGLDYIKAVRAPLNHIKMLAVGGIDEQNIKEFLDSGICGVGIGSNIVKSNYINEGSFDKITELAKIYVQSIKEN